MTARTPIPACALGALLALAGGGAPGATAQVVTESSGERFVPGEALVRFEPGVPAAERRDARTDAGVSFEESLRLARTQVVSFDGSVRAAIERLEDEPGVAYAQPNYRYRALAPEPTDTHFDLLWGMDPTPGVGVLPAWDRTRGAGQVIAILDTGVDVTHPDLAGNLWTRPGQPGVHGFDFVDSDFDPDDFNLHGTHVAGTAAAITGDGLGVAGVAPEAQIMAVRVLDGDGGGDTADIADGITFAAGEGAGVINMSLGGPAGAGDTLMGNAITFAEARGAVVVAAAGNSNNNNDVTPTTPCTLGNANLICVAAVTRTGARASYSNFGRTTVDVGAPGGNLSGTVSGDIVSTKPSWTTTFSEDFESGLASWTANTISGATWGIADIGLAPSTHSATDSPGANYVAGTSSRLQANAPVDLSAGTGCRLDFFMRLAGIETFTDPGTGQFVDAVGVGMLPSAGGGFGQDFAGDTGGFFEHVELSSPGMDGRTDLRPTLVFRSDDTVQGDGAYIDDFSVVCRDQAYDGVVADPEFPAGGSYTAIAGTSMAAPHVAGVAALVRAADPGASPSQVVQAIKDGAKPLPSLATATVSGGAADAVGAMDAALALPNTPPGGGGGTGGGTGAGDTGGGDTGAGGDTPTAPGRAAFAGRVTADSRGRLGIRVGGAPGARGAVALTASLPRGSAAARRLVARKSFTIPASGRAIVRLRLNAPARRVLRRAKRLRVSARVVLTNAAGLKSTRTKTVRIALKK